jgi:hypothetical protein
VVGGRGSWCVVRLVALGGLLSSSLSCAWHWALAGTGWRAADVWGTGEELFSNDKVITKASLSVELALTPPTSRSKTSTTAQLAISTKIKF